MSQNASPSTLYRIRASSRILREDSESSRPCRVCVRRRVSCFSIEDSHCLTCVRVDMSGRCDAEASRTDRLLRFKKKELDQAIAEVVRLQKKIQHLKKKSDAEFREIMRKIDEEDERNEGDNEDGSAERSAENSNDQEDS